MEADKGNRLLGARRDIAGAAGQAFAISSLQMLGRLRLEDSPVQRENMAHVGWRGYIMR